MFLRGGGLLKAGLPDHSGFIPPFCDTRESPPSGGGESWESLFLFNCLTQVVVFYSSGRKPQIFLGSVWGGGRERGKGGKGRRGEGLERGEWGRAGKGGAEVACVDTLFKDGKLGFCLVEAGIGFFEVDPEDVKPFAEGPQQPRLKQEERRAGQK